MTRHNITFEGGNENGGMYLSLSSLKNDGMIVGDYDYYDRITGMVNANRK